jgi:xanthine dehydrogenase accessory factor
MYDIAADIARWLAEDRTVHIAQVVATRGFSSRDPGAAFAWTDAGDRAGALFPGIDDLLVQSGPQLDGHLAEMTVSDTAAVAAGLSCGGVATVFVQNAQAYPANTWQRLQRHEPACLVSEIVGAAPATTLLYVPSDIRDAGRHGGALDIARLFARGTSATGLAQDADSALAVVCLWPTTTLVVVGDGTIATALTDTAALLGWNTAVTDDPVVAAEHAQQLTEADAVVVLSHDRNTDVPALAAVLSGRAGYVGALGSRHTQAARREGLLERGLGRDELARIHGPAGLDIDAHTPAEIAVSIVAEILAARSGASGASISRRDGPVHTGGVHAPPPRY